MTLEIKYNTAYLALGSNVTSPFGPPKSTLREALNWLTDDALKLRETSRFYASPAFPAGSGPDFVNAVARLETTLLPLDLLAQLHKIERAMGRTRKTRWAARTIDLDLIAYDTASGSAVHPDIDTFQQWLSLPLEEQIKRAPEGLILPHPRLQDRAFVLQPLCDIAPDWHHPVFGKTAATLLEALPTADRAALEPLPEPKE